MKKISVPDRLSGIDPTGPDILGQFAVSGSAMVGLVHIPAGSTDHFWERHGDGDEILYVLEGRACFTALSEDGSPTVKDAAPGDLLILARNEAHQAHIQKDLRLIFITPQEGNEAWTDDPSVTPRH
ncbi:cupin domain-containing protein [Altericroceibacterium spongiae]|uniref:Cupin domain-containing protein n=1 Tax=Altericroceibacterium spongiae TaxID=2320269 RepID=A0A420EAA5_9SPHN|nr:cupin domain-containing protein [Altericroceibacterium spongiae]RKF17609.1 cupin domain-containing protein [Altericroceibacterium spongiae]